MAVDGFDGHVEEFELSLGYVTGVRGFKLDSLSRLIGVSYKEVFRPGTNTAKCGKCLTKDLSDCTCGYYAYFQQDQYATTDTSFYGGEIGAVIRGYGRTVVGTKGFRAEKADLLGFFPIETANEPLQSDTTEEPKSAFHNLYPTLDWYRRHADSFLLWISVILSVATIVGFFVIAVASAGTKNFSSLLWTLGSALVFVPWLVGWIRRGAKADIIVTWDRTSYGYGYYNEPLLELKALCRPETDKQTPLEPDLSRFDKLRALYPDVPVYSSFREAVQEHPLTAPEEHLPPDLTPENDPDFWNREDPANPKELDGIFYQNTANITLNPIILEP